LRTRLEAGNITQYSGTVDDDDDDTTPNVPFTGTNSTRLGYDTNNGNSIEISDLHYRFPVGEKADVWVGAKGLNLDDVLNTGNPELADSGTGALSRFGRYNPLLFRGPDGAGAGVNLHVIEDKLDVNALYLTSDGTANSPNEGEGLFNGSYSAGGQLAFSPIEPLELTATYIHNYQTENNLDYGGGTVSALASDPFDGSRTSANKVGLGANLNVGEKIVLAANGGYGKIDDVNSDDSGKVWTWGANASLLDLVKEGSVLSIGGGMLPRFRSDDVPEDEDTSYLVEALYKLPLNDNISITPGAYAVFNPNHDTTNGTEYVGVVRTTFEF
jgi:Carbohydrate-selective porin, OprB family